MTIPPLYKVRHTVSGELGRVDDATEHPDGAILWRINDKWFFAKDCVVT